MMMVERMEGHCEAILGIKWDVEEKPATDGSTATTDLEPSMYMKNLVKETVKLHKILTKLLPNEEVTSVFGQIFKEFNQRLEADLSKLEIYTSTGKNR